MDYLKKEKVSILCLDDESIKNSGKILENKKVLNYIKKKSKNKKANIITFKPSPKIQKICDDNNFRYLGNDWQLNRKLENKIEFVNITNKLKIPNAKSRIMKVENNKKFQNLFDFKKKYIIQLSRGFSGNSTFLVKNEMDLVKITKKYKERKVKVSEYFRGDTYTIDACIGKFGIVISQPIFQITGFTNYNKNKFGTSGNDYKFGKNIKNEEKKKIFNYTKKIGEYMKKLGYKGIFGLDFIVKKNIVYLIEINPRLVASIPVFTKLQIQNEQVPFLLLHLAEFIDGETKSILRYNFTILESLQIQRHTNFKKWNKKNNFDASQLILRNTKNKPIKIIKSLKSGIYEIKKNKFIFKEKVYSIEKKMKKNEFLLQCFSKGHEINPNIEYMNIQVSYGIIKNGREMNSYFNNIVHILSKKITIS